MHARNVAYNNAMTKSFTLLIVGLYALLGAAVIGALITAFTVQDDPTLTFTDLTCQRHEVKAGMSMPTENLIDALGGKVVITDQQGANFVLTLYTLFGIPIHTTTYRCSQALQSGFIKR